jgi:hypothetical protein
MTIDEAKKELNNFLYDSFYYDEKYKELNASTKHLEALDTQLSFLIKYDTKDKLKTNFNQIIEKYAEEERILVNLMARKQRLEERISRLVQPYKNILYLKYIKKYRFEIIADKMSYSVKRIYQLHAESIKLYSEIFDGEISIPLTTPLSDTKSPAHTI